MSASDISQTTEQSVEKPGLSRRQALKRIGVASGTVVTLGAAGDHVAPQYSPIGRAQAIPPLIIGGAVLASGAVGGYALASWQEPETDEIDTGDVLEDQLYEAATSVADGRENFIAEMEAEFLNPDDPQQTPFGRSAWQEIRAAVSRAATNGDSESEGLEAANEALDEQVVRSYINTIERGNTGFNALIQQLTIDAEEDVGVFDMGDETLTPMAPSEVADQAEPVEASRVGDTDEYMMYSTPITTETTGIPVEPEDIEGRDEPLELLGITGQGSGSGNDIITSWTRFDLKNTTDYTNGGGDLLATHSDLDTTVVLGIRSLGEVEIVIEDAYNGIKNDLDDYVSSIYSGLQEGDIDPSDILSSQDIVDEFADSSDQARLAAELAAIGAQVPEDASYRATISHPDLEYDELEVVLFPQFVDEATTLVPGMTLESGQYRIAYIGYDDPDSGEWNSKTLSGDSDMEIHDIEGVGEPEDINLDSDTAGANGRINLPDDVDLPDNGTIIVEDWDGNEYSIPIDEVQEDSDGQRYIEVSGLSEGDTVAGVEIVPGVGYSRVVDYVSDPTNPDSEQTIERVENLRNQVDELEEALDNDDGGIPAIGDDNDLFDFLQGTIWGVPVWGWAAGVIAAISSLGGD